MLVVSELWQDAAEVVHELAAVELADKNLVELREDFLCVAWKRHNVVEVSEAEFCTSVTDLLDCRKDVSVGSAPAHYEEFAALWAVHFKFRDVVCHSLHLLCTLLHHKCVVDRI